jgi:hypothetical protein
MFDVGLQGVQCCDYFQTQLGEEWSFASGGSFILAERKFLKKKFVGADSYLA